EMVKGRDGNYCLRAALRSPVSSLSTVSARQTKVREVLETSLKVLDTFLTGSYSRSTGVYISPSRVRFSNRPFGVKRFQTIHRYGVDVARGLVLLFGIGTRGPSMMGFEDEAEQSFGRPCRQTNGRSKRTRELTSSIVPRGTSFHRSVELECPS